MQEFTYTITEEVGIHARPAGQLVKAAKTCTSKITVQKEQRIAKATNLIALMQLCARTSDTVTVRVEGADERMDAEKMLTFFEENL